MNSWPIPLVGTKENWKYFLQTKMLFSVTQSYSTLCDPMYSSPPGSSVHGIVQARVLEWVATAFSAMDMSLGELWELIRELDREAWRAIVQGSQSRTRLSDWTDEYHCYEHPYILLLVDLCTNFSSIQTLKWSCWVKEVWSFPRLFDTHHQIILHKDCNNLSICQRVSRTLAKAENFHF